MCCHLCIVLTTAQPRFYKYYRQQQILYKNGYRVRQTDLHILCLWATRWCWGSHLNPMEATDPKSDLDLTINDLQMYISL